MFTGLTTGLFHKVAYLAAARWPGKTAEVSTQQQHLSGQTWSSSKRPIMLEVTEPEEEQLEEANESKESSQGEGREVPKRSCRDSHGVVVAEKGKIRGLLLGRKLGLVHPGWVTWARLSDVARTQKKPKQNPKNVSVFVVFQFVYIEHVKHCTRWHRIQVYLHGT